MASSELLQCTFQIITCTYTIASMLLIFIERKTFGTLHAHVYMYYLASY